MIVKTTTTRAIAKMTTMLTVATLLIAMPFAGSATAYESTQRTYSPDMIERIDTILEGPNPSTSEFMIEDLTVTMTTQVQDAGNDSYIIKTTVTEDGVLQPDLALKYSVQINDDGTYHVKSSDFNLMVTDTYDHRATKSISKSQWVSGCGATVVLIGHGSGSNVGCSGHADVDASVSASSASITFDADSVYHWWIWTFTYERGYANIVGQEYEFSFNSGTLTTSGTYSSTAQHAVGGVFFYVVT